jgi:hypothetical protein
MMWDLVGIAVIIVGGVLLHFAFGWCGRRAVIAVFTPVNESVWEHLKMAYWPLVALTGVQRFAGAGEPGLFSARSAGFATAAALMLGLYFASAALLPESGLRTRLAMDGTIFVVAVAAGQLVSHLLTPHGFGGVAGLILLLAPAVVFAVTTFAPPRVAIFRDQLTGGYGLPSR